MDLNYLLHRQQVSLMKADAAVSAPARLCHSQLAVGYARRIEELVGPLRGAVPPLVPVN